jgi:hypothetical protein
VLRSRRRGLRSRSRRRRCHASTGSWCKSASRMRISARPSRSRRPHSSSCGVRLRRRASPSRWRGSRLKVSSFPFGFRSSIRSFGVRSQLHLFLVRDFQACGPPWGTRPPGPRLCRRPTTPLNISWKSCGPPPSRPARPLRKARRKLGARWRAAWALLAGTSQGGCAAPSTWASRRHPISIQIRTPRGLFITNHSFCHDGIVQSFRKTAEIN